MRNSTYPGAKSAKTQGIARLSPEYVEFDTELKGKKCTRLDLGTLAK
jgi:hypothetical protein